MARSFGLVDYKVLEAEYFLEQIQQFRRKPSLFEIQFVASAFASATRSITFAMQSALAGSCGFESWYGPKQKLLRDDPIARFFHDFRRVTQHIGEPVIGAGSFTGGLATYFFSPSSDLPKVPDLDVVSACELYFRTVLRLVYDCYAHFGPLIDAQQYFTREHFSSKGKTLDDALEEIGFPRGYLTIPGQRTDEEAWRAIRRQSGMGCMVQPQFEKWLGLRIRHPDDTDEEIAPWVPFG